MPLRISPRMSWPPSDSTLQFRLSGGFGEALRRLGEAFGASELILGGFGRLWETLGEPLGRLWEALGSFGRRWGVFGESLGGFGEALGGFGDSRHPSPNNKNNYIQKCWEYANSR